MIQFKNGSTIEIISTDDNGTVYRSRIRTMGDVIDMLECPELQYSLREYLQPVHCEECEYFKYDTLCEHEQWDCEGSCPAVKPNDYCSYGVKKEAVEFISSSQNSVRR